MYMSLSAIEADPANDGKEKGKADMMKQQWLTYWVIYTVRGLCMHTADPYAPPLFRPDASYLAQLFFVAEFFVSALKTFIPFYYAFKLALIVYLVFPKYNGAQKLYKQVVSPFYKNNKEKMLQAEEEAKKRVEKFLASTTPEQLENMLEEKKNQMLHGKDATTNDATKKE